MNIINKHKNESVEEDRKDMLNNNCAYVDALLSGNTPNTKLEYAKQKRIKFLTLTGNR